MTNKNTHKKLTSVVAGMLIPTILFVQLLQAPIANAQFGIFNTQNEPTQVTSLIAVLVDETLIEDNTAYQGLSGDYSGDLSSGTMRDRLLRFARDVQVSDPFTKSIILRVNENQTTYDISKALETLYFNGDESLSTKSQLEGVITVGDVPLPVVNKNGYKFVSLLPYTDFEEKSYIYNLDSRNFEYNSDVLTPKAETWHGVIKPSRNGEEGKLQLADYFDKNHMYHIGHEDFTNYDEKTLYADLIWEQQMLDETLLKSYENYSNHLENFAYMRFTKELLNKLIVGTEFEEYVNLEDFEGLPDVHSRNIIMSYAAKFNELFKNYLQKSNDLIRGTGRWDEYDSVVELITTKDLHTQEYLRTVNDRIEEKVDEIATSLESPIPLFENASLTGTVTFDNSGSTNLNQQDFINYNKLQSGIFFETTYFGRPASTLTSAQDCTIYRGNTEFNRVYNPDATNKTGYGGCDASNLEHPERCFTDIAINPLYDEKGVMARDDIPPSALTYAGCYDFREKTRFNQYLAEVANYNLLLSIATTEDQKAAITQPGDKRKAPEDIILLSNPLLSLKDLLDLYGGFDGKDNDEDGQIDEADEYSLSYKIDSTDPYTIGREIFANRKTHFELIDPPLDGIKSIVFDIIQVQAGGGLGVPGITYHKEPTVETIQDQLKEGTIDSLPVDDPRFVAFQDSEGTYQEIIYPNSFREVSIDEYKQTLADLETRLASMPGANPALIEGKLTELIQDDEDEVADLINWVNFTIDQKHAYAVKTYLDADSDAYIGETENGYEYFYLTAPGNADNIEFALNETPEFTDNDPAWTDPNSTLDPDTVPISEEGEESGGKDTVTARPLPEWLVYIVKYLTDVGKSVSKINFEPSCGVMNHYDKTEEELADLLDADGNGIPDGADKSSTISIEFTGDDNLIVTGSTERYEVKVNTLNATGAVNTGDSFTKVQLSNDAGERSVIDGSDTINIVNGEGSFYIRATDKPGDFTLVSGTTNRPDQLISNTLRLKSEARKIRIYTYELETVEPPSYVEETITDYLVRNKDGDVIAEIDSDTGKIRIKNPAYSVEVFESQADKRLRISVVELSTGNIEASMTFIPEVTQVPKIHESNYSFEDNALTLIGVHLKDLNTNDYVITYEQDNSVYLLDNSGIYSKRIARITNDGEIFLADEHFIIAKNPDKYNEPYIFIIEDGQGNDLAEVYIAYRLGEVKIVEGESNLLSSIFNFGLRLFSGKAYAQSKLEDDTDGDGLTDFQELFLGTDRIRKDSDQDGFSDGEEIQNGYDPTQKDLRLFTDLDPSDESYSAFTQLLLRGIIKKDPSNLIRPNDYITREEYVQMVLGITCVNCSSFSEEAKSQVDNEYFVSPFPDENISENFRYCVEEAKNEGVVSGYASGADAGYFKPSYNISRAEAVKVILEAANIDSLSYFEENTPWYYRYVLAGQSNGVFPEQKVESLYPFNNYSSEDFKTWVDKELNTPSNVFENFITKPVTRAEFAIMVQNIFGTYDCFDIDTDGDGLPDNIEIYQYNTSINAWDTDQGGLDDLSEIIANKNPLDPSDDLLLDSDNDGMPDSWEDRYNFDKFDPSDAIYDSDNDGLINVHEFDYGTDPRGPDTDNGNVKDGDEVWLQSTDPLISGDDKGSAGFGPGSYVFGQNIKQDVVFEAVIDGETEEIPRYIDSFLADGLSTLFLGAEILDENGDTVITDNSSVIEFMIKDSSQTDAVLAQDKVKVKEGVALNTITSTTKAGLIDIDARLVTGSLPAEIFQVTAEPLKPIRMEVSPRSDVMKTGGLSKTPVTITLYDQYNNVVNNNFYEITIESTGPGKLDNPVDTDLEKEGIQLQTFEGVFNIDLYSTENEGDINLNAVLIDEEDEIRLLADSTVTSRSDIKLILVPERDYIRADGLDTVSIAAQAVTGTGELLTGYNEEVVFKNSNEESGMINEDPVQKLVTGQAFITFTSSQKVTPLEITGTVVGLDPGMTTIQMFANDAYEIKLTTADGTINSKDEYAVIDAKLYDRFGNFAELENNVDVTLRLTQATENYGEIISSDTAIFTNGVAQFAVSGKGISGEMHLVAESAGLASGTITVKAVTKITSEDLVGDYPKALYGTMIGGSYGDTTVEKYLGGEMLFAGNVQAITATTVKARPNMPLATVGASGGVKLIDETQLNTKFITPNKVLISSPDTGIDIAEVNYVYPADMEITIKENANTDSLQEGIFVIQKTDEEIFDFKDLGDRAGVTVNGNEALTVNKAGRVQVSDNIIELTVSDKVSPFLILDVNYADEPIAEIIFAQNSERNTTVINDVSEILEPGIYVKELTDASIFKTDSTVSGFSTKEFKGITISNNEVQATGPNAPGFSYSSLENIYDVMGIGFDGDNKHSLFFAGGNSVGVSNIPYIAETQINLGDPTVRLDNKHLATASGFAKDIGQPLHFGDDSIKAMVLADYNNDSLDDLIIAYETGEVKLLQRQLSARPFKDKGLLLDIANGIYSMASADFNNDGYDDLLFSTVDPCVGEETCIYLYENNEGVFNRVHVDLDVEDKISSMKIGDLNNDNYPDIVLAEFNGNVKVYYNNNGEIETQGQILENLGISIDGTKDLKNEVLVHYDGMPVEDNSDTEAALLDDFDYEYFALDTGSPASNPDIPADVQADLINLGATPEDFVVQEQIPFIYIDKDPIFGAPQSSKKAVDINGSTLSLNDKVVYTITLYNNSTSDITDLLLSDFMPDSLELNTESISCINCTEEEKIEIIESGMTLRPYIIKIPIIPPGENRLITYESQITTVPEIAIDLNKNFDANYPKDDYLDISANPKGNNSGKMLFLYSVLKDPTTGHMNYAKYVSEPAPPEDPDFPVDLTDSNNDGIPDEVKELGKQLTEGDTDGDGIPDGWDNLNGAVDKAAEEINKIVDTFSCSGGGCFPIPINMALLAPGPINVMGMPVGADPGTPVFVYGPVMIYISPTLTGSLGNYVCIAGNCWGFTVPLLPPSICDKINKAFSDAMSSAGNFISSAGGTTLLSGGGGSNSSLNPRAGSGGLTGSSLLGSYRVSGSSNTNSKVPGFVNVITAWFSKQLEEIMTKLSDLPDLYVLYPDVKSFASETPPTANFKTFSDVLTYVNKLPLIEVETRSIQMKIPSLSIGEINKIQVDLEKYMASLKFEMQKFKLTLDLPCKDFRPDLQNKCLGLFGNLTVNFEKINTSIQNIEKNLKILEEYKKLPRKILEWKNARSKYINQIICYLDTIVQYVGGYFKKQVSKINGWMNVTVQIKDILKTWGKMIKIMDSYMKSCDNCSTQRYSLIELIGKIFAPIPEPPIIPFPKWPDFYFDFSQIQLGYKVILPDVQFKTEQIIMPEMPKFSLPELPKLDLPNALGIDTRQFEALLSQYSIDQLKQLPDLKKILDNFSIPNLPTPPEIPVLPELPAIPELPDLPPLPIPSLPDLPDPPKIPKISPALENILDGISVGVKIMCLLKKNIIPVLMPNLKSHIESISARSNQTTLPIDTLFSFQTPQINTPFVEKIKLILKLDLRLETEKIYTSVNEIAKVWNSLVTDLTKVSNQLSQAISEIEVPTPEIPNLPELPAIPEIPGPQVYDQYNPAPIRFVATQTFYQNSDKTLNEIKNSIANEDLPKEVNSGYYAGLRNSLLAYAQAEETYLNNNQTDSYDKFIAMAEHAPTIDSFVETRQVASVADMGLSFKNPQPSESFEEIKSFGRLLAKNTNAISQDIISQDEVNASAQSQEIKGLYVYNPETGINERILMYEGELSQQHNSIIADIDEDTDEDIIYSYGGNVYLKENYSQNESSKFNQYTSQGVEIIGLEQFIPLGPSVSGYGVTYDSGTQGDFAWDGIGSGFVSGYEIDYKNSLNYFNSTEYTPSNKIVVIEKPKSEITIGRVKEDIEITVINGSFKVNGFESNLYTFGDTIYTGSDPDTEIAITFSDSSQIVLGPNAEITLPVYVPGSFETTVTSGESEFQSNFFTNLFLQEGSGVITEDTTSDLFYKNGDKVELHENTLFFGSTVTDGLAFVKILNGSAKLKGMERQIIDSFSPVTNIHKGQIIHTMEDSVLVIRPDEEGRQVLTISGNRYIPVSGNYEGDLEFKVTSGKAEIITPSENYENEIQIQQGMLIQFNEFIQMESGTMEIEFANGGKTILGPEDTLLVKELTDPSNPYLNLDTQEGTYYSQIYAIDKNGNKGNPTETKIYAPQLCSDDQKPFVEAGPSKKQVIIFQTVEIDASQSFDTDGDIKEFYLDTDTEVDTDDNGDPADDKDFVNADPALPTFTIGPFDQIGTTTFALNAVDESGNIGKQIIEIEVIVPDITLDEASDHKDFITGFINPIANEIPIQLIRNRNGILKKIADAITDEDGNFRIEGLNYEDMILLKNIDGDVVAEIDPYSGRIIIKDSNYYVDVLEALFPSMPTRMVIIEKDTGAILTEILLIPDQNTDVTIDDSEFEYTTASVPDFEGVHIKDTNLNDEFEITNLPASDPNFTGGAEIRNTNEDSRIAITDSGGNIYFLGGTLDLRVKQAVEPSDPIIIEMLNDANVIAEIYIAINNGNPAQIKSRQALGLPPQDIKEADQDNDGMSDNFELKYGFDATNPDDALGDADNDGLSNLEEFRLGTNPLNEDTDGDGFTDSEEVAFGKDPNSAADSPFDDVDSSHPYYDSIVNLSQRNILRGELTNGQYKFNPDTPIERKDFTDIILKMLCIIPRLEAYDEPPLFYDMPFDDSNYYYPIVKEAVYQGFVTGYVGEIDQETGLNPFKPEETITRAEAVKIVLEALEKLEIVTLADVQAAEGEPWYVPYLKIARNLEPNLLKESEVKETYILTQEEAGNPEEKLTRAEFAAIADRVLQAFDCYDIDSDGDGMPDWWELANGLNPFDPNDAGLDPDDDGLTNLDEYRYGTDPFDPDTDDGGTYDGIEIERGTNAVNFPEDDNLPESVGNLAEFNDPRKGLEEGVYVVEADCNSCPCISAIDHKADLILGDIFFAVIANEDISTIFSKSNELIFKGLTNP